METSGKATVHTMPLDELHQLVKRGCLCGKCHSMRKLTEGLGQLLTDTAAVENKCTCSFCSYHRKRAADHSADPNRDAFETRPYPPESPDALTAELLCAKPALRQNSGFTGERYPTHSLCCLANHLAGTEEKFVNGIGTAPANLPRLTYQVGIRIHK